MYVSQAAPGDRYRLQPPNFGGEGDVEQFIKEFEDVSVVLNTIGLV